MVGHRVRTWNPIGTRRRYALTDRLCAAARTLVLRECPASRDYVRRSGSDQPGDHVARRSGGLGDEDRSGDRCRVGSGQERGHADHRKEGSRARREPFEDTSGNGAHRHQGDERTA